MLTAQVAPAANVSISVPVANSNVIISPWQSTLLNAVSIVGGAFAASGIDVASIVTTLTHGNFWAGLAVAVGTQVIGHLNLKNSNAATVAAVNATNPQ